MEKNTHKQPLIHITRKDDPSLLAKSIVIAISILCALLISALFINFVTHLDPISVYTSMIKGAFGTSRRTWITIRDTCLLLLISLSLAPAFRMRFWNCGAEGQILIGGLTTAALMIYYGNKVPTALLLLIMIVVSAACGALWALLPALFKAKYDTNETLFTLMMNYVAIQLVEFFVDFWDKKQSHSVGIINMNTMGGWFPKIFGQQYTLNILIVLVVTIFVYIYMRYSKHGYEGAVVGESVATARYAGINVPKVIRNNVLISGAIAGIAGFTEVAGISHTISKETAGGRGFTAIIVCWLAKFDPIAMSLISFFIVFLGKGASQISSDFGLNEYASNIITGIILFFILSSEFFNNYKINFTHRRKEGE
ncbi:MAG: ABC transporter permease [Erysipelotrichaceae bacterium]|nr:ABC transporter permease [Erysipelotrichaceae bacterium]